MNFFNSISNLIFYFLNEENSPEPLLSNWKIICYFKELLIYQEKLILNKKKKNQLISYALKKNETDRIKYLIKSYLRLRLWKIEDLIILSQKNSICRFNLSEAEKNFTTSYIFLCKNYSENLLSRNFSVLKNKNRNGCYGKDLDERELLKNFVFFKVLNYNSFFEKNIYIIRNLDRRQSNEVYCMKFKSIKHLVVSNEIVLL